MNVLSGIYPYGSYTNMGFLAALAGILTIARMASAPPTHGDSYKMDAISSCFIGGSPIMQRKLPWQTI